MMARAVGLVLVLAALGCHSTRPDPDIPARLVDPTEETRASLRAAVATALHRAQVTLADDALTRSSTLVIDRSPMRDQTGLPASGRELGLPEEFRLVQSGAECVLVYDKSGTRYPVAAASACTPL
jgi:hypothetical protein